jgi:methylenetetrahydrofolate dehydrogenase (NADP+)/methenyltetrahydrofolate cyclohydrolase
VTATVIDGTAAAEELRATVDDELHVLRLSEVRPGLGTVLAGEDPGALAYERHVRRLAEGLDYHYVHERLPADVEVADVVRDDRQAQRRSSRDRDPGASAPAGPPARGGRERDRRPPEGHRGSASGERGPVGARTTAFVPSTPASCFYLLDSYVRSIGDDPHATTPARRSSSSAVRQRGQTCQWLGLERDATVIACHRQTAAAGRLGEFTRMADVLIVAAGVRGLVTGDMVRRV